MRKLLIFHQALAPYRVDFFNHLAGRFDTELVLFDTNLVNQKFDQNRLIEKLKCRVSYLLGGFRWKDRYFRTGAIRKVWREKPDVVLGCEYSLVTIALAVYRFVFRAKFKLYTMTDDNELQFRARKGLKSVLRWLFVRLMDGIVVTNEAVRQAYEAITPKHARVRYHVVPILHDEDKMRKDADSIIRAGRGWRERHLSRFEKVALYVGRLDEVKNVKWLVSQFKSIVDVALVMVGAGEQGMEIEEMVTADKLSNVFPLGRKEGREVYEMMSMADALVLPSSFEPYGAVVGEALQWGVPCVVSDRVGAKDIINEKNGAVFKCNDAEDFAIALRRALHLKHSNDSLIEDGLNKAVSILLDSMEM